MLLKIQSAYLDVDQIIFISEIKPRTLIDVEGVWQIFKVNVRGSEVQLKYKNKENAERVQYLLAAAAGEGKADLHTFRALQEEVKLIDDQENTK